MTSINVSLPSSKSMITAAFKQKFGLRRLAIKTNSFALCGGPRGKCRGMVLSRIPTAKGTDAQLGLRTRRSPKPRKPYKSTFDGKAKINKLGFLTQKSRGKRSRTLSNCAFLSKTPNTATCFPFQRYQRRGDAKSSGKVLAHVYESFGE